MYTYILNTGRAGTGRSILGAPEPASLASLTTFRLMRDPDLKYEVDGG